jgi:hypothetical protein
MHLRVVLSFFLLVAHPLNTQRPEPTISTQQGDVTMRFHLIQSAAEKAGVSVDTIRSYCRQGLLDPERDSAGRRLFTKDDIKRIREIYLDNMTRRPTLAGKER